MQANGWGDAFGGRFACTLSQTVNWDSQPPATFPGTDYVTTTSISWAFP